MINTVKKIYNLQNVFVGYKVETSTGVIDFVPLNEANTDYQEIQQWIADGGTVIDNGGGE